MADLHQSVVHKPQDRHTTRSVSPSPSITPSIALSNVPGLDHRSVSATSTAYSTSSSWSSSSRSVSSTSSYIPDIVDDDANNGEQPTRVPRRGYMRPQGTTFSASARNRDSVMSLGSIAHMQYYFARTGLLDGKGAQIGEGKGDDTLKLVKSGSEGERENGGVGEEGRGGDDDDADRGPEHEWDGKGGHEMTGQHGSMLPPTVSTYREKIIDPSPPPDPDKLRHILEQHVALAGTAIDAAYADNGDTMRVHVLSTLAPAIRTAQEYYTSHPHPTQLFGLRSERKIRKDLYGVLEAFAHMSTLSCQQPIRAADLDTTQTWLMSVSALLEAETLATQAQSDQRRGYAWADGDPSAFADSRARELSFLRTFDTSLPDSWPAPENSDDDGRDIRDADSVPSPFLNSLSSGLALVKLHNALVAFSSRRFGAIGTWHEDTAVPYRAAENLRYWVKAAELRWSVRLEVDVLGVVYNRSSQAWKGFDQAVLRWAGAVREEIIAEWAEGL